MSTTTRRFSDDFVTFDAAHWTKWRGEVGVEEGSAVVRATVSQPAGPGVMGFAGFASAHHWFNPDLKGENGIEITLNDYQHGGEYLNRWLDLYGRPSREEDPTSGRYIMGWSITIANYHGQVSSERQPSTDRGVQIHFDWMSKRGLHFALVRSIVPGDAQKYPEWNPEKQSIDDIIKQGAFITYPCLALRVRAYPKQSRLDPEGQRVGLVLSNDGSTLSWTLNGAQMDTVDIAGHFGSSPDAVRPGALITIAAGGSYRTNVWKFKELRIWST